MRKHDAGGYFGGGELDPETGEVTNYKATGTVIEETSAGKHMGTIKQDRRGGADGWQSTGFPSMFSGGA